MSEETARPAPYDDAEANQGARTTVRPPFDPEQFARESDSMIGLEEALPSSRPTTPPPPGLPQYPPAGGALAHAHAPVGHDAVPSLAMAHEDLDELERQGTVTLRRGPSTST